MDRLTNVGVEVDGIDEMGFANSAMALQMFSNPWPWFSRRWPVISTKGAESVEEVAALEFGSIGLTIDKFKWASPVEGTTVEVEEDEFKLPAVVEEGVSISGPPTTDFRPLTSAANSCFRY